MKKIDKLENYDYHSPIVKKVNELVDVVNDMQVFNIREGLDRNYDIKVGWDGTNINDTDKIE